MAAPPSPIRTVPGVGEPAPRFEALSDTNPRFSFEMVVGRYIVMGFLGSAGAGHAMAPLAAMAANRQLFDDANFSLFWVTIDPDDRANGRVGDALPGVRVFWDFDASVSQLWGAADAAGPAQHQPMWFVVDPQLRILMVLPMAQTDQLLTALHQLPPPGLHAGCPVAAPILILPRVFEPEFCRELIDIFKAGNSFESGFMRQVGEKTLLVKDYAQKRRRDVFIEDVPTQDRIRAIMRTRLRPEIERAFQFRLTRIERYLVSCYDAEDGGHFRAHRDNTSTGTAHRRFAVSINLNAEDYHGGDLVFPEFGMQTYRPPTGGAAIFSCSLMHEARPVTRGQRFVFVPFLYDEAGEALRLANLHTLDERLRGGSP